MEQASKDGMNVLRINAERVAELLVKFLHDETTNAGFSKAVVGLSGGVDSAVVATLAARALGKQNVRGVIMPYKTSNPKSARDAAAVAEHIGIKTDTIPVSAVVDAYCEEHKVKNQVRRGNIMARARMIVLYDCSARDHALVLGTSNKTELMLGYGTLHGDMASAINPIGDLYKTQIWQLAGTLDVPKRIREKKPSADLWLGQTDEDEMGFSYKDVDRLLYYLIDERRDAKALAELGFTSEFVKKVKSMVQKNQFKRRPPVIAKVSYRTVNVDFRYVRDWGI